MRIWYVNPYDTTPAQQATRTYDFARELVRRGHSPTLFCSSFNHYSHTEERTYVREGHIREIQDGIAVVWIKTQPYTKNDWRRMANMLDFSMRAIWVGARLTENPDVIVGPSVPLFTGFAAYVLALLKRSRFVFEVRDLWPQALIELGLISESSPITWVLRKLESFLYRRARNIITVLPYADEYIAALGVSREKVVWIPNGVDFSRHCGAVSEAHEPLNAFVVMYVGGFGVAHGLQSIIDAAEICQISGDDTIQFVLVGDGPERARLVRLVQAKGLKNVQLRGVIPKSEVPNILASANALIVVCRTLPVMKYGMNLNKVFDYMASGRPIIVSMAAQNNPVEDAKAGLTVSPECPHAIVRAVKALMAMSPASRDQMGTNGRQYARQHYDITILGEKLEEVLADQCRK